MSTLQIHVGGTFADTEQRVLNAIARHEAGEDVPEQHLTFENWQTFARVMTANRLELLHHVSIRRPRAAFWRSRGRSAATTSASTKTWKPCWLRVCWIGTRQASRPGTTQSGLRCNLIGRSRETPAWLELAAQGYPCRSPADG